MFDALLICTAFATGFAAAWALGGRTRERLAEIKARADERERAAEDKLELVCVRIRERPEQHGVHDAEDRRRRTDAERER
jgi:hypothetical protein